ncbi:MAG: DegV family protein [Acidimicrobiales bacterium]
MSGVRIVTDNGCDLPDALIEKLGIVVVPLDVRLGPHSAEEMRNVAPARFWELAKSEQAIAETSAPSPGSFAAAYEDALSDGCSGVVCVTLSSGLSATYQSAVAGAASAPVGFPVVVVDSQLATVGEGLAVLEALELADSGAPAAAMGSALETALNSIEVFGTLDTLEWLRRGGRIGAAQALVGSLLSIKPVIEVRGGVVEPESRQRTRTRSLEYVAEKVRAAVPLKRLAIAHAAAADVGEMQRLLAPIFPANETIVSYIGPIIGAHTGPGTIGVALQRA